MLMSQDNTSALQDDLLSANNDDNRNPMTLSPQIMHQLEPHDQVHSTFQKPSGGGIGAPTPNFLSMGVGQILNNNNNLY